MPRRAAARRAVDNLAVSDRHEEAPLLPTRERRQAPASSTKCPKRQDYPALNAKLDRKDASSRHTFPGVTGSLQVHWAGSDAASSDNMMVLVDKKTDIFDPSKAPLNLYTSANGGTNWKLAAGVTDQVFEVQFSAVPLKAAQARSLGRRCRRS